jgi:hypothetical protein
MAGIDTSIFGNLLAKPKSVEEYDADAIQAKAGRLNLLSQQSQYDQQQRGVAEQNAFRNALSSGTNYDDPTFQRSLVAASPEKGLAFIKSRADAKKADVDLGKTKEETTGLQLKNAHERLTQHLQGLGSVRTPQDLQAWAAQGMQAGVPGISQERLAAITQELSQNPTSLPSLIQKMQMGGVELAKQIELTIPKYERQDAGGSVQFAQMNPLAGPVGVSSAVAAIKKTQSPDSIASNATSRENSIRTDNRAREFNATQVEANNIKRSEKKATEDLTKNSQVASFDTMLGTLGRLKDHAGLSRSVGLPGAFPTMPGSDSANFQAELNTFQSQAFLPMVAQLKGMGALSDAEGKKLTAAVGALDPKMGEKAFRESVDRITSDMEDARARVSGQPRAAKPAPSSGPKVGMVESGYRFKGGNPSDKSNWEKVQ